MSFIANEVPSWAINWVNKVYTTVNNISQVDDIFVDWTIYTDYTVTWINEVTLVDAPTASIIIDYYDSPTVSNSWIIVDDLRTLWELHRDDPLSDISSSLFLMFCNQINNILYDNLVAVNPEDYIEIKLLQQPNELLFHYELIFGI